MEVLPLVCPLLHTAPLSVSIYFTMMLEYIIFLEEMLEDLI